jgi:hypothetical protein
VEEGAEQHMPQRNLENWSGAVFHLEVGSPCLCIFFTNVLLRSSVPDLQIWCCRRCTAGPCLGFLTPTSTTYAVRGLVNLCRAAYCDSVVVRREKPML